ncbi:MULTISPECIES: hypothetical protein [unclassified Lacinutrix]
MWNSFRNKVFAFLKSDRDYPILAGVAAGLYPLFYYYNKNFTLMNSWNQVLFFVTLYVALPIGVIYVLHKIFSKMNLWKKYGNFIIPILNLCIFASLIVLSTSGYSSKKILLVTLVAFLLGVILKNHFKKIIVFQLLLAVLVFAKLVPHFYKQINYTTAWMQQPDAIEEVVFVKNPNVYIIQPDGYANFSELNKSNYNYDNSNFESFLVESGFKLYNNYRSNYSSTLSSNSSMFAMKHHYYSNPKPGINEFYNARDVIVGDNPVISIFKNNKYRTNLILEKSYLLLNKPKVAYDFANLESKDISYLSRGYGNLRNINSDLEIAITNNKETNNFYFVEKLKPGHIATFKNGAKGKDIGRLNYLKELEFANIWLKDVIHLINEKDPNSLIVVVADHGGFVGYDYTSQSKEKQMREDLVRTIFTSALAIKWPNKAPDFDEKLKTNVNLFRILFAYLSDDESYLNNLQEDKSYNIIEKGAPFGVYERINEQGEIVFKLQKESLEKKND